ncbi:MAG TPA: Asp23/Gls24 family envelope stress response protein [Frankiaceae bacterium]|nr:Asp23/Gls24 family envelope stress response protein [Frankiaceae bacterium]
MSETIPLTKGSPGTEGQAYGEDESYTVDALASGDAESRGSTTIANRVVEKVAGHAAVEVDHVGGVPRRLLGQSLGKVKADSQARASAKVDGSIVSVSVSVAVEYPTPVREAAAAVRANVVQQVHAICGLNVVEVHVDIPHFYSAASLTPTRRVQ